MKPNTIIPVLCLMALVASIILPVQAFTITFANPNGIAERDFMIYNSTGQLVAFVNSTSVVELDTAQDIVIMMKPVQTNPLEDPTTWFTDNAIPFVQSNVIGITVMIVLIAFLVARR